MTRAPRIDDQDRGFALSRRDFVKTVGASALAAAVPIVGARAAGPSPTAPAETAVSRFYQTLKPEQKQILCFPFDHPLRSQVNNNWAIVKPTIADLSNEQQALCKEIFKNLVSEDGLGRFEKQMEEDDGGFENYHVAVFGEPGTEKPFEWVLTGRHDTLRADGNSLGARRLAVRSFMVTPLGTSTRTPSTRVMFGGIRARRPTRFSRRSTTNSRRQALVAAAERRTRHARPSCAVKLSAIPAWPSAIWTASKSEWCRIS